MDFEIKCLARDTPLDGTFSFRAGKEGKEGFLSVSHHPSDLPKEWTSNQILLCQLSTRNCPSSLKKLVSLDENLIHKISLNFGRAQRGVNGMTEWDFYFPFATPSYS